MSRTRASRLGGVLATVGLVLAMSVPADARRSAGNEGEGPVYLPVAEPCAVLIGPDRLDPDRPRSETRFRFDVSNCSYNAGTFTVTLRGVLESGTVPTPCTTAATSVRTSIPGAGTTEVELAPPGARVGGCALSAGEYFYTATVKDASTGQTLNTLQFRTTHDSL